MDQSYLINHCFYEEEAIPPGVQCLYALLDDPLRDSTQENNNNGQLHGLERLNERKQKRNLIHTATWWKSKRCIMNSINSNDDIAPWTMINCKTGEVAYAIWHRRCTMTFLHSLRHKLQNLILLCMTTQQSYDTGRILPGSCLIKDDQMLTRG